MIVNQDISWAQYFDPKLPTFAVANSVPHISFTYYMDPKTDPKKVINIYHCEII